MAEQETKAEKTGRVLTSMQIGKFTLLNSEKLGRVLDMLEGIAELNPDEAAVVAKCRQLEHEQAVLALYDRLGGAVKLGDRKIALGTFYDFAAREPRVKPDLDEADFADEYVLVQKKTAKGRKTEDAAERYKRLNARAARKTAKTAEPEEAGAAPVEKDEPAKPARKTKKK